MRSEQTQACAPPWLSLPTRRLFLGVLLLILSEPVTSRPPRRSTCSMGAPTPVNGDSYLQAGTKRSKTSVSEIDAGNDTANSSGTDTLHRSSLKADEQTVIPAQTSGNDLTRSDLLNSSSRGLASPKANSTQTNLIEAKNDTRSNDKLLGRSVPPGLSFFQVESISDKASIAKLLNESLANPSDSYDSSLFSWLQGSDRNPYLLIIGVLLFAALFFTAALRQAISWVRQSQMSPIRNRVEQLRLTSAVELESLYGLATPSDVKMPLSPGLLMCLQGRVQLTDHSLVAPLSSRKCAMYSASVSPPRYNGVQRPPLAFHSAHVDFQIQLLDAPHIYIKVQGKDVHLFDMSDGRYASEGALAEAPDSWRSFILSHLAPKANGLTEAKDGTTPGIEGTLEFCECALVVDSVVTVVGEVTREDGNELCLHPWLPPPALGSRKLRSGKSVNQATSCLRTLYDFAVAPKYLESDPAAGNVLVSDDPSLFPTLVPGLDTTHHTWC